MPLGLLGRGSRTQPSARLLTRRDRPPAALHRGGKRFCCCSPGVRPGRERLPRDLRGGPNPATGQVRAPSRSVPRRCARHLARRRGRGGRLPAASIGGEDVGGDRGGAWDTGSNTVVCEGAGREGCAARMTAVQSSATHPSPRSGAETRETSQQLAARVTDSTSPASAARRPGVTTHARRVLLDLRGARGSTTSSTSPASAARAGRSVGYATGSTSPASAARRAEGTIGSTSPVGLCGERHGWGLRPVQRRWLPWRAGRIARPARRTRGGGQGTCRPPQHTGRRVQ